MKRFPYRKICERADSVLKLIHADLLELDLNMVIRLVENLY